MSRRIPASTIRRLSHYLRSLEDIEGEGRETRLEDIQWTPGQPLFRVRQKQRSVQFHAPAGGRVVKINRALGEDLEALEMTPYHKNWVCEIEADNLDVDVPALKIGRSAVALFQEDIDRFRSALKGLPGSGSRLDGELSVGELGQLGDAQRETLVREFFRP